MTVSHHIYYDHNTREFILTRKETTSYGPIGEAELKRFKYELLYYPTQNLTFNFTRH